MYIRWSYLLRARYGFTLQAHVAPSPIYRIGDTFSWSGELMTPEPKKFMCGHAALALTTVVTYKCTTFADAFGLLCCCASCCPAIHDGQGATTSEGN